MAIYFDDLGGDYLSAASLVAAAPLSVSAWFNVDDASASRRVLAVYGSGANRHECRIDGNPGRTISAVAATLGESAATSANSWSVNSWHHGLWTLATGNRTATLDGGTTASESTSRSPSVSSTGIGGPSLLMSGRIAELAVWNVDLSAAAGFAAIKAALAKGFSPMSVRAANLVAWFRFLNGAVHDVAGGFSLSVSGSPVAGPHPRLWQRGVRRVLTPVSAAAPARVVSLGGVYHSGSRVVLIG